MSLQAPNKNGELNIVNALYLPLHWISNCFSVVLLSFIQLSEGKQRVISWQEPVISVIELEVVKCSAIKWIPAVWIY